MRSAFFMLLAANLAFMAWAGWIDRPAEARVVESATRLPRLWFAGEKAGDDSGANQTSSSAGGELSAPASRGADTSRAGTRGTSSSNRTGGATTGSTLSPSSTSSGSASAADRLAVLRAETSSSGRLALTQGAGAPASSRTSTAATNSGQDATPAQLAAALRQAPAVNGQPLAASVRTATAGGRCLTVGPFKDVSRSGRAISLLRERGFAPKQRAENGDAWAGYWVYVPNLKTEAEQAEILRKLEAAGVMDAHSMPDTGSGLQVSVGLFSDRGGADRRARSVQRLGLNADIMEKSQAGTLYWVDLNPDGSKQAVPTEGLLALEEAGTRLEMKVCPRGA